MKTYAYLVIVTLFVFVNGCKNDETLIKSNTDYFPLQVGDSWNYKHNRTHVKALVEINNKQYFEVQIDYILGDTINQSYKTYFRKTGDGKVFMLNNTNEEEKLYYNWNIPENSSWTYKDEYDDHTWEVKKVSGNLTFKVNDRSIQNCIQFNYDLIQAVDDEYSVILAPGIGRIFSYSAWGLGDTLETATINGIVHKIN